MSVRARTWRWAGSAEGRDQRLGRPRDVASREERGTWHGNDQLVKAAVEPASERLVGGAYQSIAGAEPMSALRAGEPGAAAQGQVDRYRIGRVAVNHLGGPVNSVGGAAYPGQPHPRQLEVDLAGLQRIVGVHVKSDECCGVVRLPQPDPLRGGQASGREDPATRARGLYRFPCRDRHASDHVAGPRGTSMQARL